MALSGPQADVQPRYRFKGIWIAAAMRVIGLLALKTLTVTGATELW